MGVIGIYDSDFMNYEQVIPNLECAKLCAYYKNKNQIAVLAPTLEPERYSKFYIRKEYDDGVYPPQLFEKNTIYGGKAFSPNQYHPLDLDIEKTKPDFHIYEKYIDLYGTRKRDYQQFNRITSSANIRLSLNEKDIDDFTIKNCYDMIPQTGGGIMLHDYNIANIEGALDILQEISNSRYTLKGKKKPLAVGNKYPIDIYNSETLLKWADIYPMIGVFYLRFHGMMNNEALVEMIEKNPTFCRQIYYMIDDGCSSENDFLIRRAPEIYKQVLFCRLSNTRILLKYEDNFFKTPQLKSFITLLNCFANQKWQENFLPASQSLYNYCSQRLQRLYRDILQRANVINQYEMREVFMYIREHNYELFKMFYEWDKVYFKGGEFRNEWDRYKKTD